MPVHLRYRVPDVSIHLMLLFIMSDEEIKKQYTEFQYISCYSLSQMKQSDASAFVEFQYISCYSLSLWGPGAPPARQSFQYISCYSLSKQTNKDEWFRGVSIHLMLLFIIPSHSISLSSSMFQYISCYSLSGRSLSDVIPVFVSIHLMLLFIRASTTSLTGLSAVSIHLMLLFIQRHPEVGEAQQAFQYISCYSLSEKTFVKYFTRRLVSIHLMLLFIVIYSSRSKAKNVVSIHLMLLFIEAALFSEQGDDVFQYISCYSLSPRKAVTSIRWEQFQYISCYSLSE